MPMQLSQNIGSEDLFNAKAMKSLIVEYKHQRDLTRAQTYTPPSLTRPIETKTKDLGLEF